MLRAALKTLQSPISRVIPAALSSRCSASFDMPDTLLAPAEPLGNGTTAPPQSGARQEFLAVYRTLRDQLADDPIIADQPPAAREWLVEMLDYNVPGGKLNRGMAVLDVLRALKDPAVPSSEEAFKANALGWCIEWLQAFFLVADDIMDNSITRRGQPCWYRQPKVGMVAVNDGILLEACIFRILQRHFREQRYYVQLMEIFHETTYQTSHGQLLDLITAPIGTVRHFDPRISTLESSSTAHVDLSRYTLPAYMRIVTYKTAFYSFYLPVACGLLIGGHGGANELRLARSICVEMGQYFQIQDDYLDAFGDPEVIGKIGTDIEDNKCSWLVVQALERADPQQRAVIEANYGKSSEEAVASVKALYRDLKLEQAFFDYEQASHERLTATIDEQTLLPKQVFTALLAKIYKRKK